MALSLRMLLIGGLVLLLGTHVIADGVRDNDPTQVRPVPPAGLEIPAELRQRLTAEVAELESQLDALRSHADLRLRELWPDVAIFSRAVDVALKHHEFFSPQDVEGAAGLLRAGRERLAAILAHDLRWATQPGLVVRGFVSRLDHSVQPYGLVIPESYSDGAGAAHRLDIWLHGRGESTGEIGFLRSRMEQRGEFTPPESFVLHPYGRYSNAFKFAGEVDVWEARDAVAKGYRIDADRISIRGFSMGGAGCWQFAVHYPDQWFAANPGAGFSETPEFLRFFQKETLHPMPHEVTLWRWYDCPGYAINLQHCPTIAYSGELDIQKQAADIMASALRSEGLELLHLIGPETQHSIHADSKQEIERRMGLLAQTGRDRSPDHVEFTTYTLRYAQCHWLRIEGMSRHWERAQVSAQRGDGRIDVHTQNVTALTLDFRSGQWPRVRGPVRIEIDGQLLIAPAATTDRALHVALHRDGTRWQLGECDPALLRKRPGLQGPIDDAFMDSFLFVLPTGPATPNAVSTWAEAEAQHASREWRRQFRGDVRTKKDVDVTDEDARQAHLVLWGTPESNRYFAKLADRLPVRWNSTTLEANGQTYDAQTHVPILIYPNPLAPDRYVVLNSGVTFREFAALNNARQVPVLPDWAIVDVRSAPTTQYPGKIVSAGFFTDQWQW